MSRVPVTIFDLANTYAFLKSAAAARAVIETTKTSFEPDHRNLVLTTFYNSLNQVTGGRVEGPGYVEIQHATKRQLSEATEIKTAAYFRHWLAEIAKSGAGGAKSYIDTLATARDRDLENLRALVLEQDKIASDVLNGLKAGARNMAVVSAAGTIACAWLGVGVALGVTFGTGTSMLGGMVTYTGVAGASSTMSAGTMAFVAAGINTVRGVTGHMIGEWGEAGKGEAVGISEEWKETGKGAAEVTLHRGADVVVEIFGKRADKQAALLQEYKSTMASLSAGVAAKLKRFGSVSWKSQKAVNKAATAVNRGQEVLKTAERSKMVATRSAYAVPIAFAIADTVFALVDLHETFEQTK